MRPLLRHSHGDRRTRARLAAVFAAGKRVDVLHTGELAGPRSVGGGHANIEPGRHQVGEEDVRSAGDGRRTLERILRAGYSIRAGAQQINAYGSRGRRIKIDVQSVDAVDWRASTASDCGGQGNDRRPPCSTTGQYTPRGDHLGHNQPNTPAVSSAYRNPSNTDFIVVIHLRRYQIDCCSSPRE